MDILFIRHGETDWNKARRLQGGTAEIDINADGIRQAELARDGIFRAGFRFDRIFASPYTRAHHTAEIVAAPHHIAVTVDDLLHEMNFGPYEGTSIATFIDDNIKAAFQNPPAYVPRENGESYAEVDRRVREFLEHTLKPLEGQASTVLVVTHGGILRTLSRIFDNCPLADFWRIGRLPNCCGHLVQCEHGTFTLAQRGMLFYDEALFSASPAL